MHVDDNQINGVLTGNQSSLANEQDVYSLLIFWPDQRQLPHLSKAQILKSLISQLSF